jgi:hypothetical protein
VDFELHRVVKICLFVSRIISEAVEIKRYENRYVFVWCFYYLMKCAEAVEVVFLRWCYVKSSMIVCVDVFELYDS